ncbi:MAG: hypothetical protein HXY30_11450 [Pseudorhodoplanes sp.]|nr:hypothetical protein [Pseudorhodoplanes sp.]
MRLFLSAAALAAVMAVSGPVSAQQPQPPADARQQKAGEKATQTPQGRAGAEEPSAHVPTDRPLDTEPLVDGRLAAPGAPADSQTVPAKFSARNAWVDSLPIMAAALIWLDEAQKREIAQGVRAANVPAVESDARPSEEIAGNLALHEWPAPLVSVIPDLQGYHYARTADRVLIVREPGGVVVGTIPLAGTTGAATK